MFLNSVTLIARLVEVPQAMVRELGPDIMATKVELVEPAYSTGKQVRTTVDVHATGYGADALARCQKDELVIIRGKLRAQTVTAKSGERFTTLVVVAESVASITWHQKRQLERSRN